MDVCFSISDQWNQRDAEIQNKSNGGMHQPALPRRAFAKSFSCIMWFRTVVQRPALCNIEVFYSVLLLELEEPCVVDDKEPHTAVQSY